MADAGATAAASAPTATAAASGRCARPVTAAASDPCASLVRAAIARRTRADATTANRHSGRSGRGKATRRRTAKAASSEEISNSTASRRKAAEGAGADAGVAAAATIDNAATSRVSVDADGTNGRQPPQAAQGDTAFGGSDSVRRTSRHRARARDAGRRSNGRRADQSGGRAVDRLAGALDRAARGCGAAQAREVRERAPEPSYNPEPAERPDHARAEAPHAAEEPSYRPEPEPQPERKPEPPRPEHSSAPQESRARRRDGELAGERPRRVAAL